MRRLRWLVILIVLLLVTVFLTSCSLAQTERGDVIKAYCETMIDSILADDADAAYAVLADGVDKQNFLSVFGDIREYISDVTSYELAQCGWYAGAENGVGYYEATFKMTTNSESFYVVGKTVEGYERLCNFSIISSADSNIAFTGTITTLSGANPLQWGMILLSLALLAFVVLMFIDCCKRKIKLKALWLILILVGVLVFTFSCSGGKVNFNINLGLLLFNYSYLKLYATNEFILALSLPLGTIVYAFVRKKLPLKTPPAQEQVYMDRSDIPACENESVSELAVCETEEVVEEQPNASEL